MDDSFVSKSGLSARGWTDSLISRFLSEPDRYKKNPHYACAAPMKLYLLERVEKVESDPQFQEARAKSEVRKRASKKAVETKTAKTLEEVDKAVQVKVPEMARERLIKLACDHFNRRISYEAEPASIDSDPAFLERICVNFLRHRMTKYDRYLDELYKKVGKSEGIEMVRQRVYKAIGDAYPWLTAECERQLARRRMEKEMREAWFQATYRSKKILNQEGESFQAAS